MMNLQFNLIWFILKKMLLQFFIALDQSINTLIYFKEDGFGYADETLSARVWRLQHPFHKVIDKVFFFDKEDDMKHCQLSYLSEVERRQLPPAYRGSYD